MVRLVWLVDSFGLSLDWCGGSICLFAGMFVCALACVLFVFLSFVFVFPICSFAFVLFSVVLFVCLFVCLFVLFVLFVCLFVYSVCLVCLFFFPLVLFYVFCMCVCVSPFRCFFVS